MLTLQLFLLDISCNCVFTHTLTQIHLAAACWVKIYFCLYVAHSCHIKLPFLKTYGICSTNIWKSTIRLTTITRTDPERLPRSETLRASGGLHPLIPQCIQGRDLLDQWQEARVCWHKCSLHQAGVLNKLVVSCLRHLTRLNLYSTGNQDSTHHITDSSCPRCFWLYRSNATIFWSLNFTHGPPKTPKHTHCGHL